MADIKQFLDYAGLLIYDEEIRKIIETKLTTAKNYTDGRIGSLDASFTTVAAALAGEALRAKRVEGSLDELSTSAKTSLVQAISEVSNKIGTESNEAQNATGLIRRIENIENQTGTSLNWGTLGKG